MQIAVGGPLAPESGSAWLHSGNLHSSRCGLGAGFSLGSEAVVFRRKCCVEVVPEVAPAMATQEGAE
eukprot:5949758-Prymnesium_polylepis.1